jgi:hypothetical protein
VSEVCHRGGFLLAFAASPKCRSDQSPVIGNSAFSGEQIRSFRLIPDCPKNERFSMRLAKTVLTGLVLTVLSSVALAQQSLTGTITTVNRINGTVAIQQTQSGTVGANTGGATEQFKVQGGLLDTLHAGDKVTFSVSETGGTKTITKLEKQ